MLSKDPLDLNAFDIYINILQKSGPQTFLSSQTNSFKLDQQIIRTTSGFYINNFDNKSDHQYSDSGFNLNKTVGNTDRHRITAMFPVKSLGSYGNEHTGNKLAPKQVINNVNINPIQQPPVILSGMQQIYKTLSQNQLRL